MCDTKWDFDKIMESGHYHPGYLYESQIWVTELEWQGEKKKREREIFKPASF